MESTGSSQGPFGEIGKNSVRIKNPCGENEIILYFAPSKLPNARMAELVDALVSNTNNFTVVPVRPRLRVPSRNFSKFFENSGFFDSLNPLIDQRCRRLPNLFSGFDNRYFLNRRPSRWERAYFGTAVFGSSLPTPMFY